MSERGPLQAVCVLLPVWGRAYLDQCLEICLPSLLAPGNVPALAAAVPTSVVLITRARDFARVRAHPAWRALAMLCDARLEAIDPLLSEAHSVVLTLAYARAIRALGPAARATGFIFLVADYLLADGALRHVLRRLQGGADAVMLGNLMLAREALPALRAIAAPMAGVALAIPPRALVGIAGDWLHPATTLCLVGDGAAHDRHANRVFWPAGADGLVGRFYLMHMLAIRPRTLDVTLAGPCDYSFVPEFCRDGRIETITDSDDCLVVEMQPAGAAARDIAPGTLDPAKLARSLAHWVTPQHRANAAHAVIAHARGSDTPALAAAIAQSAQFIAETERRLGPIAHPHRWHPYWGGALDHHRATALAPMAGAALEAILGPGASPESGGLRRRLLGRLPQPRPWHPRWADLRALRACLAPLAAGKDLLIVSRAPGSLRAYLAQAARDAGARSVSHREPDELHGGAPARCTAALVIVRPAATGELAALLDGLADRLADKLGEDARIVLALSDLSDSGTEALPAAAVAALPAGERLPVLRRDSVAAPRWRVVVQSRMLARARAAARARARPARLAQLGLAMAWAGLSLLANVAALRGAGDGRAAACSTTLLLLAPVRRPRPAAAPTKFLAMAHAWTA